MKVMGAHGYGPINRLRPMRVPDPVPGAGQVRVRVIASAINPADYKVLLGTMRILHSKATPLAVGYDLQGTVDVVGDGVTKIRVGDDVFGCWPSSPFNWRGAFAEDVVVRADELALKPAMVSHRVAAAAATPGLTGLQGLHDLGRLPAGGRGVVTGGW